MRFSRPIHGSLTAVVAALSVAAALSGAPPRAAAQQPFADGPPLPEAPEMPQPYGEAGMQSDAGDAASQLGFKSLRELSTNLENSPGRLPENYAEEGLAAAGSEHHGPGYMRSWAGFDYWWLASGLCHRPLYFEEIYLERHGYNFGCAQPLVSAAHFFGRIPALPYMMAIDHPCDHLYTLGHYRPGSCAPFRYHVAPLRAKAGLVEAGVITGLVFLIP